MRSFSCHIVAAVLTALCVTLSAGPAPAETVNCTPINAVPVVITVQGNYCLTKNLTTNIAAGNAIQIDANNVVLDLNGFRLGNLAAGSVTGASGIFAVDRRNITVKNGIVRGFYRGIDLGGSPTGPAQGYVVEDIRAEQNYLAGIQIVGLGSIIRNNQVIDSGDSTLDPSGNAFGIVASGSAPRVLNNDVINVIAPGGTAWGILFSASPGGMAVNNRITNAARGIEFSAATGKYRDNLTMDVAVPYTGGTSVGTND